MYIILLYLKLILLFFLLIIKEILKNYFTSSDPHHDMSGGGCQVGGCQVGGCRGELEALFAQLGYFYVSSQLVTKNHEETPQTCFLEFCVLLFGPVRPSI